LLCHVQEGYRRVQHKINLIEAAGVASAPVPFYLLDLPVQFTKIFPGGQLLFFSGMRF